MALSGALGGGSDVVDGDAWCAHVSLKDYFIVFVCVSAREREENFARTRRLFSIPQRAFSRVSAHHMHEHIARSM